MAAGAAAVQGNGGGKDLPPPSDPAAGPSVRELVADQERRVQRAITKLNDYVQNFQRDLKFSVDEELGRPVVQVIDSTTNEIIRQIPNDVAIRLARNLNAIREQALSEQFGGAASDAGRLGLINTRV
ncbi:MAG: flagellar protein FlaG [Pseudomonadales bacterium]